MLLCGSTPPLNERLSNIASVNFMVNWLYTLEVNSSFVAKSSCTCKGGLGMCDERNRRQINFSDLADIVNSEETGRLRRTVIITEPTFSHVRSESRPETFYGWVYGTNQGPHTVPYKLMSNFIHDSRTTIEKIQEQIVSPESWKNIIENEKIMDTNSPKFLSIYGQYSRYHKMFEDAVEHNKRYDTPSDIVDDIESLGYLSLAEKLINLHPYATYHWRDTSPIDDSSEEGMQMLAGDGTERRAASIYKSGRCIDSGLGFRMLDGLDPKLNQFRDQEGFKAFLNLRLSAVLNPDIHDQVMKRVIPRISKDWGYGDEPRIVSKRRLEHIGGGNPKMPHDFPNYQLEHPEQFRVISFDQHGYEILPEHMVEDPEKSEAEVIEFVWRQWEKRNSKQNEFYGKDAQQKPVRESESKSERGGKKPSKGMGM